MATLRRTVVQTPYFWTPTVIEIPPTRPTGPHDQETPSHIKEKANKCHSRDMIVDNPIENMNKNYERYLQ